jgi:hypothetical protein
MIDDPIILSGVTDWSTAVRSTAVGGIGKYLFSISGKDHHPCLFLSSINSDYRVCYLFSIHIGGDPKYRFKTDESTTSKEGFIKILSEKYPEYLEWILFHPEWLQ